MGRTSQTKTRGIVTILMALLLVVSLASPSPAYPRPGMTELITAGQLLLVDAIQPEANEGWGSSPSADGRFVAFQATGRYTEFDTGCGYDIYVRDRKTQTTEWISMGAHGLPSACAGPGTGSYRPDLTPSGRYVAFFSGASNLLPDETAPPLSVHAYLHDRTTGKTELVSVSPGGGWPNGSSSDPAVSDNGRFVTFRSEASNLVSGDTNETSDVFVYDRKKGTTERVSVTSQGEQATHQSMCGSISANGRYVRFLSRAPNLNPEGRGPGTPLAYWSAYVHDRKTLKTELVSVASDGSQPAGLTGADRDCTSLDDVVGRISGDGRYVLFRSDAPGLVPNDRDSTTAGLGYDIFRHDRKTGRTERISVNSFGEGREHVVFLASEEVTQPTISDNGRYIAFGTNAPNFFEGDGAMDTEGRPDDTDIFVHDSVTGATELAMVTADGSEPTYQRVNFESGGSAISKTGRFVSFFSHACNLDPADEDDCLADIFIHDRGIPLGVGGFGDSKGEADPPDDRVCVTPDVCIPPGSALSSSDAPNDVDDALTQQGANLYGASLAHRPQYSDLFVKIELGHMPEVVASASPIFYGLRFKVGKESYEVRATSLNFGTFGLFDCTDSPTCSKVADLRGGYGTTGMRVVFSLPLKEIGLESEGELRDVVAFSGLGSYFAGATKVLDRVKLK